MLKEGEVAPGFELADQAGEMVTLSGLLKNGPVVLYFYPIDFSPVCTAQACAMRDNYESATVGGIQIIGVSPQSSESHARFASAHDLPFPLLADASKKTIRAYGVDGLFGMGTRRATFLIGQDGLIKNRVVSDLTVGPHTDLLNAVVQGAGNSS